MGKRGELNIAAAQVIRLILTIIVRITDYDFELVTVNALQGANIELDRTFASTDANWNSARHDAQHGISTVDLSLSSQLPFAL